MTRNDVSAVVGIEIKRIIRVNIFKDHRIIRVPEMIYYHLDGARAGK